MPILTETASGSIFRRRRPLTRAILSAVLPLTALLEGCGAPMPHLPPPPPHGGTAFAIPEVKGFVEVLRQDVPGQAGMTELVVYFLDAKRKPLGTASRSATFKPKVRGASAVVLKPAGDAELQSAGALASEPFPDPGEITGVLSATIDNRPVTVPISIR